MKIKKYQTGGLFNLKSVLNNAFQQYLGNVVETIAKYNQEHGTNYTTLKEIKNKERANSGGLWSTLAQARDARIGAVGAQEVRDLYSKGRNEEAKALANMYMASNLTGASLPIAFGGAGPVAADIVNGMYSADMAKNLLSNEGIAKTIRLANAGDTSGAIKSGLGDALNLLGVSGTGRLLGRIAPQVAKGKSLRNAYIGDILGRSLGKPGNVSTSILNGKEIGYAPTSKVNSTITFDPNVTERGLKIKLAIPEFNEWASKYGYKTIDENSSIGKARRLMNKVFNRHNTFYRGLHLPDEETTTSIKNIIGENASDQDVLNYIASKGSIEPTDTYVSPLHNASMYGNNVAVLRRNFKLGKNPYNWTKEADFNFDYTPAVYPTPKGTVNYPWGGNYKRIIPSELRINPEDYTHRGWLPKDSSTYGGTFPATPKLTHYKGSLKTYSKPTTELGEISIGDDIMSGYPSVGRLHMNDPVRSAPILDLTRAQIPSYTTGSLGYGHKYRSIGNGKGLKNIIRDGIISKDPGYNREDIVHWSQNVPLREYTKNSALMVSYDKNGPYKFIEGNFGNPASRASDPISLFDENVKLHGRYPFTSWYHEIPKTEEGFNHAMLLGKLNVLERPVRWGIRGGLGYLGYKVIDNWLNPQQ